MVCGGPDLRRHQGLNPDWTVRFTHSSAIPQGTTMTQAMELKSFDTLEERVASLQRDGFAYFPGYLTDA